jgi:hypothetical protein
MYHNPFDTSTQLMIMESGSTNTTTMQQSVTTSVGNERVEAVFYHEQQGSLDDSALVWREYTSMDELPQKPLDGWEELLVFTDTHVYRWIETGFTHGPTVLPRAPKSVIPEPSFVADEAQSSSQ